MPHSSEDSLCPVAVRRYQLVTAAEIEELRDDEDELDGDGIRPLPKSRTTRCVASTHIEGQVDAREQSCYSCQYCHPKKLQFHRCTEAGAGPMIRYDLIKES